MISADPTEAEPPSNLRENHGRAERSIAIDRVGVTLAGKDVAWLRDCLHRVAERLSLRAYELQYVIVDDAKMAELHEQFSGASGTTDVLTFDLSEPAGSVEGEIYLCADEAQRQADGRGHELRRELLLYAVHGLLHLLGYDDHDPEAYRRMHVREDELLEAIGVGSTFADRGGGA